MEGTPTRASGIPRPSKLPTPRTTSAIPRPTPTKARPTSTVRPRASRDSLYGSTDTLDEGDDGGRASRLRPSASRDQLRSSGLGRGRNPTLRSSASRDHLASGRTSRSSVSTSSHTPASSVSGPRGSFTPARRTGAPPTSTPKQSDETALDDAQTDEVLFKRRLTLTRRPSEVFSQGSLSATSGGDFPTDIEDPAAYESMRESPVKSRPSLSERTMETLARIPPSPAVRRKSSAFFDQGGRPKSRADSAASRPGSSQTSDGSARVPSRAASRPGSSGGYEDSGFRASSNTFRVPLSTIDDTPPATRSSVAQTPKIPTVRKSASRASLKPAPRMPTAGSGTQSDAQSPTTAKKPYGTLPLKQGSRTVAARSSKPRSSVGGLFKKSSMSALDAAAADSDPDGQSTDAWDGTIAPPGKPPSSARRAPAPSTEPSETLLNSRKSSAALRDQIAKAKAAKRAAVQKAAANPEPDATFEAPIVPSDDGFDFGMPHDDPFNLRKGENANTKLLQQRVGAARTTGRLNIAALGLKEMPAEVTKMYDLGSAGANDGSWAESVDLTRLVAADNELEKLDESLFPDSDPNSLDDVSAEQGSMFAGLETIDLHNNLLLTIPPGFRWMQNVTSLNLTSNRLSNDSIDVISNMTSLRDLKLAKNLFFGPINSNLSNLTSLEILDLHGNNISVLPWNLSNMSRLRILNLSENSFESLPFDDLAKLPLTDLQLRKNKLSGTLIDEPIDAFPDLQTLDASSNKLERLVPLGASIEFPVLHALSLSMNRLQGLPDMTSWTSLLTLTVDENSISGIPNSFTTLEKLRHADFSSNDIRVVPPEIAKMDNLTMIRLSGNPLRDKKFISITTEELKDALSARLEPPPPYHESGAAAQAFIPGFLADAKIEEANAEAQHEQLEDAGNDSRSDMDDDFATPPTSAPHSPARSRSQTVSSLRSRSRTLSNQTWPVKSGGVLDRSRTESSSLHPVVCSKVAADNVVKQVMLHHNLFPSLPNSLSFFADTLAVLSLASNQLVGESYIVEDMEFPALKELNLSSNRITVLEPLAKYLHAPGLEKLDVSLNRINALPSNITEAFPQLKILLAANNQIAELEPDMIRGLRIVDASSNEIARLNPKLGLLGGSGGLERLDVMGNRFRVPRWNVLERGTESTLRWLRSRVPVSEMSTWRGENGNDDFGDVD